MTISIINIINKWGKKNQYRDIKMNNIDKIKELELAIKKYCDYEFKNSDYLINAFAPRTSQNNQSGNNYEVLEFIGDKVVGMSVVKLLVQYFHLDVSVDKLNEFRFKHLECFGSESYEGILTKIEDNFTKGEYLTKRFNELNLDWKWILNENEIKQNNDQKKSVQENIFEDVIDAITIDSNFNYDKLVTIVGFFLDFINFMNHYYEVHPNYVGKLQEWSQDYNKNTLFAIPHYEISDNSLTNQIDPISCFVTIKLSNDLTKTFIANGKSSEEVKYEVSRKAYEYLRENGYIKSVYEKEIGILTETNALSRLNELIAKNLCKVEWNEEKIIENGLVKGWKMTLTNKIWGEFNYIANTKKEAKNIVAYNFLNKLMKCK